MNDYVAGSTSIVETIFLQDSASTVGAGKTGLTYNTGSLTCYYKRSNGTASVAVSLANITTLGTFVSGGFKEIDGTNQPGLYEFHPPDAALAAGAKWVVFYFVGASGLVARPIKVRLLAVNPDNATTGGLGNLDDTVSSRSSQSSVDNLNDVSVGDIRTELTSELLVMTRLGTAITLDGAVYQFTTNALENAPGGSTTVTVMPVSGSATIGNVLDGGRIKGQYGAPLTGLTITCTTTNAGVTSARDLTAYNGALALVVFENDDEMDYGTRIVNGADITVASNVATISSTASHVLNTLLGENLRWCLRQDTTSPSIVFAIGDYTCQRAPVTA